MLAITLTTENNKDMTEHDIYSLILAPYEPVDIISGQLKALREKSKIEPLTEEESQKVISLREELKEKRKNHPYEVALREFLSNATKKVDLYNQSVPPPSTVDNSASNLEKVNAEIVSLSLSVIGSIEDGIISIEDDIRQQTIFALLKIIEKAMKET